MMIVLKVIFWDKNFIDSIIPHHYV